MFPTFTGSSRRPRNVNLSGQKNVNPFAAAPSGGTSKSVADAQAERRQRQQERERLKAAQDIQRTWRGHRARRNVKSSRRQAFDDLYRTTSNSEQRLVVAFPLLLSLFDSKRDDDFERLTMFVQDLGETNFAALESGELQSVRLIDLVRILISALQRKEPASSPPLLLVLLVRIVLSRPDAILNSLGSYFRLLVRYFQVDDVQPEGVELLQRAVLAPLSVNNQESFVHRAYEAFSISFLTQPLSLFEKNIPLFSKSTDLDAFSASILRNSSSEAWQRAPRDNLLWLLSHFVALQKAQGGEPRSYLQLKALYSQLSMLSIDIRDRFPAEILKDAYSPIESNNSRHASQLPRFMRDEIKSLVDREEISELLAKFTLNYSETSTQQFEDASLLAGYILSLIRCFPSKGDDIRMRLYLSDIASQSGKLPAVKFFWVAMTNTAVYKRILGSSDNTLQFLLQRNYFKPSTKLEEESLWDREWRTALLFLELYTFVLRLTDDEDFFAGLGLPMVPAAKSSSRVRLCAIPLGDLARLSSFLKNLAYTLHYNSAELLRDGARDGKSAVSLDMITTMAPHQETTDGNRSSIQHFGTYDVIPGLDFGGFKAIVTTAIRMLYERDSRRSFLPKKHWLMTSKFDMEGFISAVVIEEQRQHELQEAGDDSDNSDGDEVMEDDDNPAFTTWAGQRRTRHAMMEKFKDRQRKAQRDRLRATVGPKLEILRNMPYVIPFTTRVQIFRQFILLDKQRRRDGHIDPDQWRMHVVNQNGGPFDVNGNARGVLGRHHAKINRGQLFEDAFKEFYGLGDGLKEPIQITFVDQFGSVEAGIDGGGVTKEFLTSVSREAFDEQRLFVANESNALYPNPFALDQQMETLRVAGIPELDPEWSEGLVRLLEQFEFLGRIVGKCLYEGILIDIAFAGFFLLKWSSSATDTGYRASINDLREMDEELYQGMLTLKNYAGDISALDLDFTINDQISQPGEPMHTKTRVLIPNGEKVAVTNENRPLYISYTARHRLVAQPFRQTQAFLKGLGSIIDPSWLSMFNQSELQRLVGGDSSEIDVEDLRRNTVYSGVYEIGDDGQEHPTVKLFWQVMRTLQDAERRDVLKYVTSTPRAPLLGFSQLRPHFSIRDGGGDQERLPSASTCVNLLKLPRYKDVETLRSKLLYAVSSNAGFDLS